MRLPVCRIPGLAVVLLACLPAVAAAQHLDVTGFQSEGSPPTAIDRSAGALTTVGVDGVVLDHDGSAVQAPDRRALAQLARAHADHLRAELLVSNYSDRIDDFSEPLAHRLLSRPAAIGVAAALAEDVRTEGWDGISVDLESLRARDRAGLTHFVRALRAALPAGASLSLCVMNELSARAYRSAGYALTALGRMSRIELMTYDEHGPWERQPGPIGALSWQRRGLAPVIRAVGAADVDLGVAGYGYAWLPHHTIMLSDAAARRLVARHHARAHWVARIGEWTAHLPHGSTVWWSDARSYARRARLAQRLHLHGLAVWSLGLSDPLAR